MIVVSAALLTAVAISASLAASTECSIEDEPRADAALLQRSGDIVHKSSARRWSDARNESSSAFSAIGTAQEIKAELCQLSEPLLSRFPPVHGMKFPGYFDNTHGKEGLFVYPPANFAFCLIEKNGCSAMIAKVLQHLLADRAAPGPIPQRAMGVRYEASLLSQRKYGVQGIERIFQNPGATRAVFVREPLERFASTFLNKCATVGGDWANCPTRSRVFSHMVDRLVNTDFNHIDGHWRPQALHCELQQRIQGYNMIAMYRQDTFEQDMNCMLSRAGLDSFVSAPTPTFNLHDTSTNRTAVLQKLFTREAAVRLIGKLKVDYKTFHLPRPAWLEGATGEWYNIQAPDPKRTASNLQESNGVRPGQTFEDDEENDLVELAIRAGYIPRA